MQTITPALKTTKSAENGPSYSAGSMKARALELEQEEWQYEVYDRDPTGGQPSRY